VDAGLAQDAQDTNVRDAARESARERETHARAFRGCAPFGLGQGEQSFFGGLQPTESVRYFARAHSESYFNARFASGPQFV
jgi:hypothetical protein